MSGQTIEEKREYIRMWRQAASEAEADHHQLTKVRNRLLAGTAGREEIFLAVNSAATKMLVFSGMANSFGNMLAIINGLKDDVEKPAAPKAQPALRLVRGGGGKKEEEVALRPRKKMVKQLQV
jgi:hypothetical protein